MLSSTALGFPSAGRKASLVPLPGRVPGYSEDMGKKFEALEHITVPTDAGNRFKGRRRIRRQLIGFRECALDKRHELLLRSASNQRYPDRARCSTRGRGSLFKSR